MKVHHILAPNPGIFTGMGTNTYVVASMGEAVIIDPGPTIPAHMDAVREETAGYRVAGIFVTHYHPDHAPAANPFGEEFGVPVYGRDPGPAFKPDKRMADGDEVPFGDLVVEAVYTPGHTPDHTCFKIGTALFTGDHIMGGSTVVIEEMAEYLDSLERVAGLDVDVLYPGHGPTLDDPAAVIRQYREHRAMRERQIIEAMARGASTVGDVVHLVYADVDPALHFAAAQSTGAHLRKLVGEGKVELPDAAADWTSRVVLKRGGR